MQITNTITKTTTLPNGSITTTTTTSVDLVPVIFRDAQRSNRMAVGVGIGLLISTVILGIAGIVLVYRGRRRWKKEVHPLVPVDDPDIEDWQTRYTDDEF